MANIFRRVACWLARGRALSRAEAQRSPEPIARLLRRFPEAAGAVVHEGFRCLERGAVLYALVHGAGLARAGAAEAMPLVRALAGLPADDGRPISHPPVPWESLPAEQAEVFVAYLARRGTLLEVEALLLCLTKDQLLAVRPDKADRTYPSWRAVNLARQLEAATLSDGKLMRAADVLRRHPSLAWVPGLLKAWLALDDRVRQAHSGAAGKRAMIDRGRASRVELAAGAVLAALGACAARDPAYRSFDRDDQTSAGLSQAIDEHEHWRQVYNGLVDRHHAEAIDLHGKQPEVKRELISELLNAKERLRELSEQITQLRQQREHHSPGYLLWCVLREAQRYPITVRQGAAWGLHFLLQSPSLTAPARERIRAALDAATGADGERDFRERRVQLLRNQTATELALALRDGWQWMVDLAESRYTVAEPGLPAEAPPTVEELEAVVRRLCDHVPQALAFLTRYPLSLMPLDQHRQVLGVYTRDGCQLSHWTQYTGEHLHGEVQERYLRLVDRARPNGMGISYRLFSHPLLVLPVLFHEHLHYGGPAGDPKEGIANEAEVLVREIIFAKGLMARLAEGIADADLPAYELGLVERCLRLGAPALLLEWLCDIESDEEREALNERTLATYGTRLSPQEARQKVGLYFRWRNADTQLLNATDAAIWCPEKQWPYLGRRSTHDLSRAYHRALARRWQTQHSLSRDDHQRILDEPASCEALAAWQRYCRRPNACEVLAEVRAELGLSADEQSGLMVRRFDFEPHAEAVPLRIRAEWAGGRLDAAVEEWRAAVTVADEVRLRQARAAVEAGLAHLDGLLAEATDSGNILLAVESRVQVAAVRAELHSPQPSQ